MCGRKCQVRWVNTLEPLLHPVSGLHLASFEAGTCSSKVADSFVCLPGMKKLLLLTSLLAFCFFYLLYCFPVLSCSDFCSYSYYYPSFVCCGFILLSFFQLFEVGDYITDLRLCLPLFCCNCVGHECPPQRCFGRVPQI